MEIRSFDEFWPFYVGEHSLKVTRIFHFWGTNLVIASLLAGLLTHNAWWLLAAPVGGYAPAWISHFGFEKNRPASFKYPLWSLMADFIMWSKQLAGTMDAEVARLKAVAGRSMTAALGPNPS